MTRPGIFLSYTKSKSAHEGTLQVMLRVFAEKFAEHEIDLVDPMTDLPGEESKVSTDVYLRILRSDAMFVIEFPSVPNTSFEAGLATALAIPIVFWLPTHLPGNERKGFHEYQRYLDQRDSIISLPSDQGDRKHSAFPGNLASSEDAQSGFAKLVEAHLHSLRKGPLSDHSIAARRRFRDTTDLNARLLREYTNDRELCWILSSLTSQHRLHLQEGPGMRRFQIDESIYLTFLNTLSTDPEGTRRTIAVADIGSSIEKFWFQDGAIYPVGERIFRLPWQTFFNDEQLDQFLRAARELAQNYPIYVTDSDTRRSYITRLNTGISGDFVVYDTVVGNYDQDTAGNTKLVIRQDKDRSIALRKEFERSKRFSVQVRHDSQPRQIRQEWLASRSIGVWPESWGGGDRRDDRYYDSYDIHIKTWIPDYDELLSRVAGAVISFASSRLGSSKILVGEIGVGTGAVAKIVARWHDALLLAGFRALSRYIAVDTVQRMCKASEDSIHPFQSGSIFNVKKGRDFQALHAAAEGRTFDVVCGSLILHYLVDGTQAHSPSWSMFFNQLDRLLATDGIAVFGGPFFEQDAGRRQTQVDWWQASMEELGLAAELAKTFIERNAEMLFSGDIDVISQQSAGRFEARLERLGDLRSPFGVLTFTRTQRGTV